MIFLIGIIYYLAKKLSIMKKENIHSLITDSETGLGNLVHFKKYFDDNIFYLSNTQYYMAYLIIDIEYLKTVNSELNFNEITKYTANVITSHIKGRDAASRISENGFALVFRSDSPKKATHTIESIVKTINNTCKYNSMDTSYMCYASLCTLTRENDDCEMVLFNLRKNCYNIAGTDRDMIFCDSELMNLSIYEHELTKNISRGFENSEFKLYLQYIVENKTGKIVSAEALSRWENPSRGLVFPGEYIEHMENSGLIVNLDYYMFEAVCKQLEAWQETEMSDITVSCNITRITLSENDFIERINAISDKYNFRKDKLILEITEDSMEKNVEKAKENVSACKKIGFKIALDDLGSGYTSLINLCSYPIDIVKIDRDIMLKTNRSKGKNLFSGVVSLAHNLDLKVVCEGVETDEQYKFVSQSECDYIQGWYFSKPFPATLAKDMFDVHDKNTAPKTLPLDF